MSIQIKLWGVRGSCPTPIKTEEYLSKTEEVLEFLLPVARKNPQQSAKELLSLLPAKYKALVGGNTTCIEITEDNLRLIIDLGTGARELGYTILGEKKEKQTKELHILMTHTHWDHIQGWPFFIPAYLPDYTIHFYSSIADLKERLEDQQNPRYFPLRLEAMQSKRYYHYIPSKTAFTIGRLHIHTERLIHPGGSTSYKIEADGKSFIFATDTEFSTTALNQKLQRYQKHFQNADLLIMDGQYSLQDSFQREGWGHTAMTVAVDCAILWGVKKMLITHHEPSYSDEAIWRLFAEGEEYLETRKKSKELEIKLAQEGAVYHL